MKTRRMLGLLAGVGDRGLGLFERWRLARTQRGTFGGSNAAGQRVPPRRRHQAPRPRRLARACRPPPSSAARRARPSTSSRGPGYVENGSTYPEYDWVTDFQKESGLHGQARRRSGRRTRRTRCSRPTRSSSTSCRRRVTPACGSSAAASSSRSTSTCSRTTRTSSRRSRTSRTTPSTACPTASRTAAARTC